MKTLPFEAVALAGTQSASELLPGLCSCHPGHVQTQCVSGTQLHHHNEHRSRSIYTVLK